MIILKNHNHKIHFTYCVDILTNIQHNVIVVL